jgi:hypothetical protein
MGESLRDPSRCQVDRQRKSVHLDEERNNEGGKSAESSPVPLGSGLEKAEREDDEQSRVDNNQ